jgi:hypothetical protein
MVHHFAPTKIFLLSPAIKFFLYPPTLILPHSVTAFPNPNPNSNPSPSPNFFILTDFFTFERINLTSFNQN